MKPAYLKKVSTGECFAYSPWLEARGDMVPWTGPLPDSAKPPADSVQTPKQAIAPPDDVIVPPAPAQEPEPATEEAPAGDAEAADKESAAMEESKEETGFVCEVCGFEAKTSSGLRLHMNKHK